MKYYITLNYYWKTYVCTCLDKELRTATKLYANEISETKYRCRNERASFEKVIDCRILR